MGDRKGSLKSGYWVWDSYNWTVIFVSSDGDAKRQISISVGSDSSIAPAVVPDTTFKDTFGSSSQMWHTMQIRRVEANRKLRQPIVTELENIIRDDLADLRSMVARDYAALLTGVGDSHKFHHMYNENNVSLSDKDRRRFELFIKLAVRVVWIALKKKNLTIIEKEMSRLLRTPLFSLLEHDKVKMHQFLATPEETRVLRGKACKPEKTLLHRSPLTQEIVLDSHDYRMISIGVTDVDDRCERLDYLRMAYTAPEELLQELNVGVGILGVPKKFLDAVLNEELMTTKKRSSIMQPIPDFVMPPATPYDDVKLSEMLPKIPCLYKESPVAARARKTQCKVWRDYIENYEDDERDFMNLQLSQTSNLHVSPK